MKVYALYQGWVQAEIDGIQINGKNYSASQILTLEADNAEQAARIKELEKERDHWKEYSSGQGKLIESGVFVTNDEYVRLTALEAESNQLRSELAESAPAINARFETSKNGITGIKFVDVKRVEYEDDGSLTVVIDYWPEPARAVLGGKSDE